MMDEGAGDLTASQFQERMEELAVRMGYDDTRDAFYGSFETLTKNRAASAELLRLALTKARFDEGRRRPDSPTFTRKPRLRRARPRKGRLKGMVRRGLRGPHLRAPG
jgi:Predicted Zn-dependent peptidases